MLGINTNASALQSMRYLQSASDNYAVNASRLSSGLRINEAADDAAGLAISSSHLKQIKGLAQAQQNILHGLSMLQHLDGTLSEIENLYQKGRQIAVQASNESMTNAQRLMLDQVYKGYVLYDLDSLTLQHDFNGINMLDGSHESPNEVVLQIGMNSGDTLSIRGIDLSSFGYFDDIGGEFAVNTAGTANSELIFIDQTLDYINTYRAEIGAIMNRLQSTSQYLDSGIEKMSIARGKIIDADYAKESLELAKNEVYKQSGMNMLARANSQKETILQFINV